MVTVVLIGLYYTGNCYGGFGGHVGGHTSRHRSKQI